MTGLFIIAHAPLATSLKTVAEHAFGEGAAQLGALDVQPNMPLEEIEAQARQMLDRIDGDDVLIFTDVFGATPCNVAQRLADGARVKVVTGVNVPMLWRTMSHPDEPIDASLARALAGATQGVMQVATSRPQNQTPRARGGQGDSQDQQ